MTIQTPPPDFSADRAHYDLSDDFFRCCLDPSMSYSCGYFETAKETLEEAQMAKIDQALRFLDIKPRDRLLEVGCGWGATAKRAVEKYGASYIGLTLSLHHAEHTRSVTEGLKNVEIRVEGWETFDQPCDKIVSFGAFEHFTSPKYDAFFGRCRAFMPLKGRLALQTITQGRRTSSFAFGKHVRFMVTRVFPGANIPRPEDVVRASREQGFELVRAESLRFHYARTLEAWAANLEKNREAAIRATNERIYDDFLNRYLRNSAAYFRSGEAGAHTFLFEAY